MNAIAYNLNQQYTVTKADGSRIVCDAILIIDNVALAAIWHGDPNGGEYETAYAATDGTSVIPAPNGWERMLPDTLTMKGEK